MSRLLLKNMRNDVTSIFPHETIDSRSLKRAKEFIFLILNHKQKYGKELLYPTG